MQAQTGMTRATKRGMAGRIWPAGRQFDTPALNISWDRRLKCYWNYTAVLRNAFFVTCFKTRQLFINVRIPVEEVNA